MRKRKRTVEMPGHGSGGKPKAGFPPLPQPLEIAGRFPHSHRPGGYYFNFRKEPWRPVASLPPPGSFLDENMLNSRHCRGGGWSWHRQPEHRLWHRATPRIGH